MLYSLTYRCIACVVRLHRTIVVWPFDCYSVGDVSLRHMQDRMSEVAGTSFTTPLSFDHSQACMPFSIYVCLCMHSYVSMSINVCGLDYFMELVFWHSFKFAVSRLVQIVVRTKFSFRYFLLNGHILPL